MLAELRSKEGTVGAWEVVVPPPPPLLPPSTEESNAIKTVGGEDEAEVDVKPVRPAEDPHVNEDDTRVFKVRQKKMSFLGKRLGSLYDPGEIIIKKKPKVEESEPAAAPTTIAIVSENEPVHGQSQSEPKRTAEDKGGWTTLDEQVNPTVVLPQANVIGNSLFPELTPATVEQSTESTKQPEKEDGSQEALQGDSAVLEDAPSGSGPALLFKPRKVKRPPSSGSSRRGRF
jgi:WW domain-binding protein 4